MRPFALVILASALALGACGPKVTITDDIDFTWDFEVTLDRFEDDLHDPYVRGAEMRLYVTSDDDEETYGGWEVTSSDPSVFQIMELDHSDGISLKATGVALAEGDVTITVTDGRGEVIGDTVAHVRLPDRVSLEAHGYLILGRDDEASVGDLRLVEEGTATYLVRYWLGDTELFGNGVLSGNTVGSTGVPLGIEPRTSNFFEDREWLTVHAHGPGVQELELAVDGAVLPTRTVTTVPETDIADVVILAQNEGKHDNGDWLVLLAQAYDAMGRRLFGINYEWNVGGAQELGVGDLYRYELDTEVDTMVTATRAGHTDSVMIHSEEGFVDSSNNIGCSTNSPTGWLMPLAGLAGVVLCGTRGRRRRAGRRASATL